MMTLIFYNAANEVVALSGTMFTVKPLQERLAFQKAVHAGLCGALSEATEGLKYVDITHRDKLQIFGGALEQAHSSAPHGDHVVPDLKIEEYAEKLEQTSLTSAAMVFINLRPIQESNRTAKTLAPAAA